MPTAIKVSRYLQIVLMIAFVMYFTKVISIPMAFGLLVAIVLYPFCRWLERHGWSKNVAITAGLLLVFIIAVLLIGIMIWQVNELRQELPQLSKKSDTVLAELQQWITKTFGLTLSMQLNWLRQSAVNVGSRLDTILVGTVNATASILFNVVIIPLFTALFLYYRSLILEALYELFGEKNRQRVHDIAIKSVEMYHNYIKGLLLVYLIVGILNTIGLSIIGIKQAILFGFVASILTIIPYIGIAIGALLPISVAWIMHDSMWYPVAVVAVFGVVQYLEANIIFPWVVGVQLRVNTLASVIALFLGGVIWGVSGMVLFLPMVAILKIVADNVEDWQSLAILLGPAK